MSGAAVDLRFNARQRFDRFDVEFYGAESTLALSKTTLNAFGKKAADAKIFTHVPSGQRGTLNELVIYFSQEKGITRENVVPDSVKQAALAGGKAIYAYCMTFDVEPAAYSMETVVGTREIRRLDVWFEYTVTPKA